MKAKNQPRYFTYVVMLLILSAFLFMDIDLFSHFAH